jgi:undecaprenyl-diphosphatase
MNYFDALILGAVQGATEFIPVSSSGHLIIIRDVLGITRGDGLAFDAILQLATTLAVLVYFRKDILRLAVTMLRFIRRQEIIAEDRILLFALAVGTVPAVILGLFLEKWMETTFRSSLLVALTLVAGAALMYAADRAGRQGGPLSVRKGFWIGVFQTLALVPGISRSGATISGGLFLGLSREAAARFSFLLSFPILAGSGAKKLLDLIQAHELSAVGPDLLFASITAFAVGLAAIHFLLSYLKSRSLSVFVWYRLVLAAGLFIFLI